MQIIMGLRRHLYLWKVTVSCPQKLLHNATFPSFIPCRMLAGQMPMGHGKAITVQNCDEKSRDVKTQFQYFTVMSNSLTYNASVGVAQPPAAPCRCQCKRISVSVVFTCKPILTSTSEWFPFVVLSPEQLVVELCALDLPKVGGICRTVLEQKNSRASVFPPTGALNCPTRSNKSAKGTSHVRRSVNRWRTASGLRLAEQKSQQRRCLKIQFWISEPNEELGTLR